MSEQRSRRGQLLIASAQMMDPNFARSVVLIVRDDDTGFVDYARNRRVVPCSPSTLTPRRTL